MLSNTIGFQVGNASTSKSNNFKKSTSRESYEKKKIINTKPDCNMFMSTFETFENALSQLDNDNVSEKVLEKLIRIEEVLKEKILLLSENNKDKDVGVSKKLSLSVGNLHSKAYGSFSEEFLKRVNCPFCSESQTDKIKLIEHLDEDCKPRINKMFDEKQHFLLSAFQILPNNSIKCNICLQVVLPNLWNYFEHLQKVCHISAYYKLSKVKNYTEFLFCACCKVQVPNNYTQINFHMNHYVHKVKSENAINSVCFLKKGVHCVYVKSKKFKCLNCPLYYFKTPGDIIKHFEENKHTRVFKKNAKINNLFLLFCEICSKEVHMFEIFSHFMSSDHKDKEDKLEKENYEMCFFCGFVCDDLMNLSLHMDSKCSAIESIKKKNPKLKKKARNDSKEYKTTDESNIDDGGCVLVKVSGYKDISSVFAYFEQFGEITSLEMYDGKHVMIKFKEKKTAEYTLLLKDRININGVKLEIMTLDEFFEFKEETVVLEERQILSDSENSHSSCDSSESEEDTGSIEDGNTIGDGDQLQSLFQKVTSHLVNISQKLELTGDIKNILRCSEIFIGKTCNLVGFADCGLSFPVESISIYFTISIDSSKSKSSSENISVNNDDVNTIIFLRKLSKKMCESELWENVITSVNSFPYIKCRHKETQKTCTFTCAKSAELLTEMLRDCVKENSLVRSFCILIRFWLTVHKLKIKKFEYVVMSLFIFFLISKNVVNLSREKYYTEEDFSIEKQFRVTDKLNENSLDKENKEAFNLQRLFHKFLEFLSTFDFDKLAIYLPLPYPVPKIFICKKLKNITESSNYDEIVKSSMYITESNLLLNLAVSVSKAHVKTLLEVVNGSVENYRTYY